MATLALFGWSFGEYETLLRLLLAVVLGGVIGLERQFHGRPAGLRTHIMVCLGATMAMLAAGYLSSFDPKLTGITLDPARIAAGVLTGIGFIGAGAILRLKDTHRGLTTAACVWFAAALGVTIGVGSYAVAIGGTLLALFVLIGLRMAEGAIHPHQYRELAIVADRAQDVLDQAQAVARGLGLRVRHYDYDDNVAEGRITVVLSVKFRGAELGEEILARTRSLPGVQSIAWRFPAAD